MLSKGNADANGKKTIYLTIILLINVCLLAIVEHAQTIKKVNNWQVTGHRS